MVHVPVDAHAVVQQFRIVGAGCDNLRAAAHRRQRGAELVAEIGEVAAPNAGCFLRGILSDTRLGVLNGAQHQASADAGCYGQVGGDQDRRADKAERQKAPQPLGQFGGRHAQRIGLRSANAQ